jgi:hypothetical protein
MTGRLYGDLVRENHLSNESNIRLGARESSASHGLHPIPEHEVSAPSFRDISLVAAEFPITT